MRTTLLLLPLGAACLVGCSPQWHSGLDREPAIHVFDEAAVFRGARDSVSLVGCILYSPPVPAFTDYGFKVYSVRDDTGRELSLRSYQIFWAKQMRFEAEFSPPDPAATSLHLDVAFSTRSGVQRLTGSLPIRRDVRSCFGPRPYTWDPGGHRIDLTERGQRANRIITQE